MPAASCTLNMPQPKVPPVSSVTRAAMSAWRSSSSSDARCSAPRRSAGDVADQPGNARSAASTAARAFARAPAASALPPSAWLFAPVPGSSSAPTRGSVIAVPLAVAARDLYAVGRNDRPSILHTEGDDCSQRLLQLAQHDTSAALLKGLVPGSCRWAQFDVVTGPTRWRCAAAPSVSGGRRSPALDG